MTLIASMKNMTPTSSTIVSKASFGGGSYGVASQGANQAAFKLLPCLPDISINIDIDLDINLLGIDLIHADIHASIH
ncbi:hypothetical protein SAMD00019534_045690 [Acytostelium subglobosum LB1]|uniref:hypothetical protein n=1 Tax=Acytostelium subglobosum LB1 TaxID=1410327 RepID=UPI000644D422|nr:hypothetical protein SAMD00019534_045690 [Acytostelium subglobosum LB1]GAM21394.1 hypothetical protein SAMD00019534_045690 [Acytostelium subglobosum LB1]|eukprot:XP_012755513.1 hypothetical protein SAMD00019534_045690 [Acytostelium subglobosum LB1]